MNDMMMGGGFMGGIIWLLIIVALALAIGALIKYLFFDKRP